MKEILAIFFSIISLFTGATEAKIKGIILPHHDLAKEIFHTSLTRLKESQVPSTIVIYGTNHYFPESQTFTTTQEIQSKYNLDNVLVDNERIKKEHSIQTLTPYLNEYFPNVNIIPIIVSSRYEMSELDSMSKTLIKILPEDTLYIASVDFSHNSTVESGLEKNKESIEAISKFDYQKVLDYHDDHIDSPVAISVFMKTMENLNAKTWETWISSHGGLITNSPTLNGTSYLVGAFR